MVSDVVRRVRRAREAAANAVAGHRAESRRRPLPKAQNAAEVRCPDQLTRNGSGRWPSWRQPGREAIRVRLPKSFVGGGVSCARREAAVPMPPLKTPQGSGKAVQADVGCHLPLRKKDTYRIAITISTHHVVSTPPVQAIYACSLGAQLYVLLILSVLYQVRARCPTFGRALMGLGIAGPAVDPRRSFARFRQSLKGGDHETASLREHLPGERQE